MNLWSVHKRKRWICWFDMVEWWHFDFHHSFHIPLWQSHNHRSGVLPVAKVWFWWGYRVGMFICLFLCCFVIFIQCFVYISTFIQGGAGCSLCICLPECTCTSTLAQMETGHFWCLPPGLRAVIWFDLSICTLVILPSPLAPVFTFFYFWPSLLPSFHKFLYNFYSREAFLYLRLFFVAFLAFLAFLHLAHFALWYTCCFFISCWCLSMVFF